MPRRPSRRDTSPFSRSLRFASGQDFFAMRPFINDEFLLQGQTARGLFAKHAAAQPIIDYHCHIPAQDIAENRRFRDLTEIWLAGDHYKWRAMRADGVAERY